MLKRNIVFGLCMAAALPVYSQGSGDFRLNLESVRSILAAAKDSHFRMALGKAHQTMETLRALRDYAEEVSDGSERLRREMLDNHYEDMVNTKLLPVRYQTIALSEGLKKTCGLEKQNVDAALKQARAGDYAPIEMVLGRIQKFGQDYEAQVKAAQAQVDAVRKEYSRHFGNAKTALSQFTQSALVQELLNNKPKLVNRIELKPAEMRPLQWTIHLIKERGDYNDPRFDRIPRTVSVQDGQETSTYPVVIR